MEDNAIVVSEAIKNHYDEVIAFKDSLLNTGEVSLKAKNNEVLASLNAVTKVLTELVKLIERANNAETYASIKQVLITTLKETDIETAEHFIDALREKSLIE